VFEISVNKEIIAFCLFQAMLVAWLMSASSGHMTPMTLAVTCPTLMLEPTVLSLYMLPRRGVNKSLLCKTPDTKVAVVYFYLVSVQAIGQ
jgi:ABC-type molybdate transport system permease subunit